MYAIRSYYGTHTASGLVARVKASAYDLAATQAECLAFMAQSYNFV